MAAGCGYAVAQSAAPRGNVVSQPASYAFANELGSGVYDVAGRTLQVYKIPFGKQLRTADGKRPGLRLTLPVTVGFFNFSPLDVVHTRFPSRIDSLSFVPGLEMEFVVTGRWRVTPYAHAGGSFASSSLNALLYGAGVASEYKWTAGEWSSRLRNDLGYAAVDFRTADQINDHFTRLRNGLEMTRGTGLKVRGHEIELGAFTMLDYFVRVPRSPLAGVSADALQLEPGIDFGARPDWLIRGFAFPHLGVGYRFAGALSGWHIVIGAPF